MGRRIIGILIIILGLIAIIGIVYFIFFYEANDTVTQKQTQITQPNTLTEQKEVVKKVETSQPVGVIVPSEKRETGINELKRLASAFTERFGSFSNQSDYGNILDLKLFMTNKMKVWADDYVSQAIAKDNNNFIYYGITTKSVSQEVKQYDPDSGLAEILVATSRREAIGSTSNATSFNQNILIKLVRERGSWKIDSAYWQDK